MPPLVLCRSNKDPITPDRLSSVRLLVLGRPNEPYTAEELEAIRVFVGAGGSLLALSGDGGDSRRGSNLNAVVSPYGMRFGTDSVLRTAYHSSPYLHPKDCLITHPVVPSSLEATVKRFVLRGAGKGAAAAASSAAGGGHAAEEEARRLDLRLAFPRGCTVAVTTEDDAADDDDDAIGGAASLAAVRRRRTAPSPITLLTSGFVAYPVNQPIAAAFEAPHDPVAAAAMSSGPAASSASGSPSKAASRREGGRVVAAGSGDWMADKWLGKEHNSAVADAIVRWLLRDASVTISPEPSSETPRCPSPCASCHDAHPALSALLR